MKECLMLTRIFFSNRVKLQNSFSGLCNIGGKLSHEFHVLADAGEDELGFAEV